MKSIKYILPLSVLPILLACGGEEPTTTTDKEEASNSVEITEKQFQLGKMELGTFKN